MTKLQVLKKRVFLRNVLAFAAMIAICGGALALVLRAWSLFKIEGFHMLFLFAAVDALCGILGYFSFAGDARLRTVLVFFSVIAFGAVAVVFLDPEKTFYPLLNSLPLAAIAAAAARATGLYMENSGNHTGPKGSN